MIDFESCKECGIKLKKVRHPRTSPKNCYDCRPPRSPSYLKAKEVCNDILNNPIPISQTELGNGSKFEDCPIAVKEYELEKGTRFIRKTTETTFGVSSIHEMGTEISKYLRYKKPIKKFITYKKK